MPTNKPKRRGATHASGKPALRFKKGTKNDSEAPAKKKINPNKSVSFGRSKKPIPGDAPQQPSERAIDYLRRRREYRKNLKK